MDEEESRRGGALPPDGLERFLRELSTETVNATVQGKVGPSRLEAPARYHEIIAQISRLDGRVRALEEGNRSLEGRIGFLGEEARATLEVMRSMPAMPEESVEAWWAPFVTPLAVGVVLLVVIAIGPLIPVPFGSGNTPTLSPSVTVYLTPTPYTVPTAAPSPAVTRSKSRKPSRHPGRRSRARHHHKPRA